MPGRKKGGTLPPADWSTCMVRVTQQTRDNLHQIQEYAMELDGQKVDMCDLANEAVERLLRIYQERAFQVKYMGGTEWEGQE